MRGSDVNPSQSDREKFQRMATLQREVFERRATVNVRDLSARKRCLWAEHESLAAQIPPEALRELYREATVSWDDQLVAAREDALRYLASKGFTEGNEVIYRAHSWLPTMPGHTYRGRVKVSKHGEVYVSARDPLTGKASRYDLWRYGWEKV